MKDIETNSFWTIAKQEWHAVPQLKRRVFYPFCQIESLVAYCPCGYRDCIFCLSWHENLKLDKQKRLTILFGDFEKMAVKNSCGAHFKIYKGNTYKASDSVALLF